MRAAGTAVGKRHGSGTRSTRGRFKGHTDGAFGSCRYTGPASIGLGKVAGIRARDRNAGNTQGRSAGIAQSHSLSRAGCPDCQAGEGEGSWGKAGGGASTCPGARKAHTLRAAGTVVGKRHSTGPRSTRGRLKSHTDGAFGSCRYAGPASIGLGKVAGIRARDRNAGNTQGRSAGIAQSHSLSRAGCPDGQAGEGEGSWGKAGGGASTCPGARKAHTLRAAGTVVGKRHSTGPRSTRGRLKSHTDGAFGSCRYAGPASIGLAKVARVGTADCDAGYAQGRVAGVGQGNGLRCTGGLDSLISEGQAGG